MGNMGQSVSELRRWRAGLFTLDHRQMNEPVDAINQMNRGVGVPRQVMETVGGGAPAQAQVKAGTVLLAMDAGLTDDHLVCRAVGSDSETYTPILVAKPWLLRKTPWDGQTREQVRYEYDLEDSTKRTAFDSTDATIKRDEQIHARYLLADVVNAIAAVTDVELDTGEVGDDGLPIIIPVTLLDLNVDSRGWKTYYEWL